jgi:hypothetical protein
MDGQKVTEQVINCRTCGLGLDYRFGLHRCPMCLGRPQIQNDGRQDWEYRQRAMMIYRFGPQKPGDEVLAERYPEIKYYVEAMKKVSLPRENNPPCKLSAADRDFAIGSLIVFGLLCFFILAFILFWCVFK